MEIFIEPFKDIHSILEDLMIVALIVVIALTFAAHSGAPVYPQQASGSPVQDLHDELIPRLLHVKPNPTLATPTPYMKMNDDDEEYRPSSAPPRVLSFSSTTSSHDSDSANIGAVKAVRYIKALSPPGAIKLAQKIFRY